MLTPTGVDGVPITQQSNKSNANHLYLWSRSGPGIRVFCSRAGCQGNHHPERYMLYYLPSCLGERISHWPLTKRGCGLMLAPPTCCPDRHSSAKGQPTFLDHQSLHLHCQLQTLCKPKLGLI